MLKNILFVSGGTILFLSGCFIFGLTANLNTLSLHEAMRTKGLTAIKNPSIVIIRKAYVLQLYSDSLLVKEYRAVFGPNPGPKKKSGDNATPVGAYAICRIDTSHSYEIFIQLNYPNIVDLNSSLKDGYITQNEFDLLRFRYYYQDCKPDSMTKVQKIGIHGIGQLDFIFKNLPFVFNWTNGSAAVSNESIREIYSVVTQGTSVVIKEN